MQRAGRVTLANAIGTGLADEIFDDIVCPIVCDNALARRLGVPFTMTSGGKIARNFSLRPYGRLTGRATDSVSGVPIVNLRVEILASLGGLTYAKAATTNGQGVYEFTNLGTGTFVALTAGTPARTHTDEILGDLLCIDRCDTSTALASGRPIGVTAGAVTSGIDFALDPGATISGRITHPTVVGGPQSVTVEARVRVGTSLWRAARTVTNQSGGYTLSGLPAGSYVVAAASDIFVDEVFNDRPCQALCREDEMAAGTVVSLPVGGAVSNVDIGLGAGGAITGTIREAGTGTPLVANVQLYRQAGTAVIQAERATSNASGAFTVTGLAPGAYFVTVVSNGYVRELFGGVHWSPTTEAVLLSSTPVAVANGQTTQSVDLALDRAATITGRVGRAPSNAAVEDAPVVVYRAGTGEVETITTTNASGSYTTGLLPAGTFFVATDANLANQVYNGVPCPGGACSGPFAVANGAGIPVSAGGTATGIDFTLGAASGPPRRPQDLQAINTPVGVQFTWRASALGAVATGYFFEAGNAPGTTFATVPVASTSFTVPGVPPGTYFVRVRSVNGAGVSAASDELTLRISSSGHVLPNAPSEVTPILAGGRLSLTWRPPTQGPVPSSYLLEVGSAEGSANIAVLPVPTPSFLFNGVPPGTYFVRVRSVVAGTVGPPSPDAVMVAANAPAPPSEPQFFNSRVAGNVVTLSWFAPVFGPATRYVLEAGTASGLSNIVVFDTGSAATSLVVPGVPPGTYFLRLRAVNAQGVSLPSFERELVVP